MDNRFTGAQTEPALNRGPEVDYRSRSVRSMGSITMMGLGRPSMRLSLRRRTRHV